MVLLATVSLRALMGLEWLEVSLSQEGTSPQRADETSSSPHCWLPGLWL